MEKPVKEIIIDREIYGIVSEMVFNTIKEKSKGNIIYVEFYKDSFLHNVVILSDYSIEKLSNELFDIYQNIRKYNIKTITKIDTIYTTTIKIKD